MRGKKAKSIRKVVYGEDKSPRHRVYRTIKGGQRISDLLRRQYQSLKKQLQKRG